MMMVLLQIQKFFMLAVNEHFASSSNKMFGSACLPFTLTGATAVFSRQMEPLDDLATDSGRMIAVMTVVGFSDVFSGVLVFDVFGAVTVYDVASDLVVTSCDLMLNSAPQRLE